MEKFLYKLLIPIIVAISIAVCFYIAHFILYYHFYIILRNYFMYIPMQLFLLVLMSGVVIARKEVEKLDDILELRTRENIRRYLSILLYNTIMAFVIISIWSLISWLFWSDLFFRKIWLYLFDFNKLAQNICQISILISILYIIIDIMCNNIAKKKSVNGF